MNGGRRGVAAALAFGLVLEPALLARADEPAAEEAKPAVAQPTANAEAAAKAAFARGSDAFRVGRYAEAIQDFEDAYRLSHKVEILFNLGLANRRAYRVEQKPEYLRRALAIYGQFMRLAQDPSEQDAARRNIEEVTGELAALEERDRLQRLRAGGDPPLLLSAVKLASENRLGDALVQLQLLLDRGGNPAFVVQDTYRLQGELAAQDGQHAVAIQAYERLLALSPGFDLPKGASARVRADFEKARGFWAEHGSFSVSPVVPPPAEPDKPLIIPVAVENDALAMVARVSVHYRRAGVRRYSSVSRSGPGDIDIPALALPSEENEYRVEYFVSAYDLHGNTLTTVGGESAPLSFPVLSPEEVTKYYRHETPWYASWWFWLTTSAVVATAATLGIADAAGAFSSGAPNNSQGTIALDHLTPRR